MNIADLIVAQQTNANANNANANEQAVGGGPLAPLGLLKGCSDRTMTASAT